MRDAMKCYSKVYFIRPAGMAGPVKIGISIMPEVRLAAMLPWCPFPLEIVATLACPRSVELRLHHKFEHLHTHREWFRADPELDAVIESINSGTFDWRSLPKGKYVTFSQTGKPVSRQRREAASLTNRYNRARARLSVEPPVDVRRAARSFCSLHGEQRADAMKIVEAFIASAPSSNTRHHRA